MSTITKLYTFSSGATILAEEHNTNFDTLYNWANGNIDNSNIKSGAGIVMSKLDLTGDATFSGDLTLSGDNTFSGESTFSGDVILGTANQGDIWYDDGTKMTRLTPGTDGQILTTGGTGANPAWKDSPESGIVKQIVNTQNNTVITCNSQIPLDNTKPQNDEGVECFTCAITPTSSTNKLLIQIVVQVGFRSTNSAGNTAIGALFQDDSDDALLSFSTLPTVVAAECGIQVMSATYYMTSGTTSETTFKVRVGHSGTAGDTTIVYVNGGIDGAAQFNGTRYSSITITEISA